jgi:hypothetical protein
MDFIMAGRTEQAEVLDDVPSAIGEGVDVMNLDAVPESFPEVKTRTLAANAALILAHAHHHDPELLVIRDLLSSFLDRVEFLPARVVFVLDGFIVQGWTYALEFCLVKNILGSTYGSLLEVLDRPLPLALELFYGFVCPIIRRKIILDRSVHSVSSLGECLVHGFLEFGPFPLAQSSAVYPGDLATDPHAVRYLEHVQFPDVEIGDVPLVT